MSDVSKALDAIIEKFKDIPKIPKVSFVNYLGDQIISGSHINKLLRCENDQEGFLVDERHREILKPILVDDRFKNIPCFIEVARKDWDIFSCFPYNSTRW